MLERISELLEKMDNVQTSKIKDCLQKGRFIVYTLFVSSWWSLNEITGIPDVYVVYLIIAMVLLVLYLALELFNYMLMARRIRMCHEDTVIYCKERLKETTENRDSDFILSITDRINKISDVAFEIFIWQLILLLVSVFFLGIYYFEKFNIL